MSVVHTHIHKKEPRAPTNVYDFKYSVRVSIGSIVYRSIAVSASSSSSLSKVQCVIFFSSQKCETLWNVANIENSFYWTLFEFFSKPVYLHVSDERIEFSQWFDFPILIDPIAFLLTGIDHKRESKAVNNYPNSFYHFILKTPLRCYNTICCLLTHVKKCNIVADFFFLL